VIVLVLRVVWVAQIAVEYLLQHVVLAEAVLHLHAALAQILFRLEMVEGAAFVHRQDVNRMKKENIFGFIFYLIFFKFEIYHFSVMILSKIVVFIYVLKSIKYSTINFIFFVYSLNLFRQLDSSKEL